MDATGIENAVRRINAILQSADGPPVPPFSSSHAQKSARSQRIPPVPPFPRSEAPEYAEARTGGKESSESETIKFGVALQIGEVVKPGRRVYPNDNALQRDKTFGSSKKAIDLTDLPSDEDHRTSGPPFDTEDDRKLPARKSFGGNRTSFPKEDHLRLRTESIASPARTARATLNWDPPKRASINVQEHVGVYSDADEANGAEAGADY